MSKKKSYVEVMESIRKGKCPACGTVCDDITYSSLDIDGWVAYQHAHCENCDNQWNENYVLTGISDADFQHEEGVANIRKMSDILMAVLEHKEILPILMGIDSNFDALIEKKLKEK